MSDKHVQNDSLRNSDFDMVILFAMIITVLGFFKLLHSFIYDADARRILLIAGAVILLAGGIVYLIYILFCLYSLPKNLASSDAQRKAKALERIQKIPRRLILPKLFKALRHENPVVRRGAAEILGELGDKHSIPGLLELLRDSDTVARYEAITALGLLAVSEAMPEFIRLFYEEQKEGRRRIIIALGFLNDKRGVDLLLDALRDEDAVMRKHAVESLRCINDRRRIVPLVGLLNDPHPDVRLQAAVTLHAIYWKPQTDQEHVAYEIAHQNWKAPILSTPAAVEPLLKAIEDTDAANTHACVNAIMAIGKIGDTRAVPSLIKIIERDDPSLREITVTALGDLGDVRAAKPLSKVLQDENPNVRAAAARGLGSIRHERAQLPIIKMLGMAYQKEKNPDVRQPIIAALGNFNDHRIQKIFVYALKNDDDADVRSQAADELDQRGWQPRTVSEQIAYHIAAKNWEAVIPFGALAVKSLIKLSAAERNRELREKIENTLRQSLVSVDTMIFSAGNVNGFAPRNSLRNFEVSDLTVPLSSLKRVIIDTGSYDFHLVERFLTYAINYVGQAHLKEHVDAHIYGEPKQFHSNLRNNFENFCQRVIYHDKPIASDSHLR